MEIWVIVQGVQVEILYYLEFVVRMERFYKEQIVRIHAILGFSFKIQFVLVKIKNK